ncbi:MAG: aspartate aminotransferase family protein [Actinobacteria bacterium]|jgi:acetylornithine/succinyldiaminopimelate/putrescine aminotransferase|nr:aspartate aminotransferase family protein [Actinomycetota bacterium]MCL6095854.1 aspartate aminotransferase family protein [Actinomycetota bacterium]
MGFDLGELLEHRMRDGYELHARYVNPQLPAMLRAIGFDRNYRKAYGAILIDDSGLEYLDLLAGFGVAGVGRNHPVVRKTLEYVLNGEFPDLVQFDCPPLAGLLAEQLLKRAPHLGRVYFCNSGTEAVEAALKFARFATKRPRVLYLEHAYHGLTAGSLSVNGNAEFRNGFGPLLADTAIRMGDLDRLKRELRRGDVAALIVEPIQGKGVYLPPPGFLLEAQDLLRQYGALFICDEVQSGVGRTGRFFAYEHEGLEPDLVTVAKALSGGFVPIGATLGRNWIHERVFSSLDRVLVHDSTFGANNLAMAAGLATLAVIDEEDLISRAASSGEFLINELRDRMHRWELLSDVRGRGLMIGFEFASPKSWQLKPGWWASETIRRGLFAQAVVLALFHRHRVLTQVSGDRVNIIKLLPPLGISDEQIKWFLDAFDEVMHDAHRSKGLIGQMAMTFARGVAHR